MGEREWEKEVRERDIEGGIKRVKKEGEREGEKVMERELEYSFLMRPCSH